MATPFPPSHIVNPTAPHTHTIIFLHGRGSNAAEFCSEIFESQDSNDKFFTELFPGAKWVFPCAPLRHVVTEDEAMHQWFDMTSVQHPESNTSIQRPGLQQSITQLTPIITSEAQSVPLSNIILAGISQGCATAVYTLLSTGLCVGGLFGLCGWLPLADDIGQVVQGKEGRGCPVLLQHCRDDAVVPVKNGEDLGLRLEELGMRVEMQIFEEGGHWLNEPEGMDSIVAFVRGIVAGEIKEVG